MKEIGRILPIILVLKLVSAFDLYTGGNSYAISGGGLKIKVLPSILCLPNSLLIFTPNQLPTIRFPST
jgi:hypothetical protein